MKYSYYQITRDMMEDNNNELLKNHSNTAVEFDYDNTDWPRDFDIRIEVAEQREVLEQT